MTRADGCSPATCRTHSNGPLPAGLIVTLGLLVAGTTLADEEAGDPGIACSVSGYDVIIRNTGTEPLASGTSVDWSVPFARMEGSHALTGVLEPGGRIFLNGALGSNFLSSTAECAAGLASEPDQSVGGDDAPAPSAY